VKGAAEKVVEQTGGGSGPGQGGGSEQGEQPKKTGRKKSAK
jgi:hypothetical protein